MNKMTNIEQRALLEMLDYEVQSETADNACIMVRDNMVAVAGGITVDLGDAYVASNDAATVTIITCDAGSYCISNEYEIINKINEAVVRNFLNKCTDNRKQYFGAVDVITADGTRRLYADHSVAEHFVHYEILGEEDINPDPSVDIIDESDLAILAMTCDPIKVNKHDKNKQSDIEAYVTVDGDYFNIWLGFRGKHYKIVLYGYPETFPYIVGEDNLVTVHSAEFVNIDLDGYKLNVYRLDYYKDYYTGDIEINAYIELK